MLVDDDHPVENTVKGALQDDDDFEYLGCVRTRDVFKAFLIEHTPDLILIDLQLPSQKSTKEAFRKDINFEEGFWMISCADEFSPSSKVIAFSNFFIGNPNLAKEALKSGADALLPKQNGPFDSMGWQDWLKYNLRMVAREEWQPDATVAKLLEEEETQDKYRLSKFGKLSEREQEVLRCYAEGMKDEEIATILNIAPTTVRTHIRNIIKTLHSRNRYHLKEMIIKENDTKRNKP